MEPKPSRFLMIISILMILSAIVGAFSYRGLNTSLVSPIVNSLYQPGSVESPPKLLPFKEKSGYDPQNSNQPMEEAYEMMDFEEARDLFIVNWIAMFGWFLGFVILIWYSGIKANPCFNKILMLVGFGLALAGLKLVYKSYSETIMAFDTMGISGGSDPGMLTISIGHTFFSTLMGWLIFVAASIALLASSFKAEDLDPSQSSRILPITGIVFGSIGLALLAANFLAEQKVGNLLQGMDPSVMAVTISKFLMSGAMANLCFFLSGAFAMVGIMKTKKRVQA